MNVSILYSSHTTQKATVRELDSLSCSSLWYLYRLYDISAIRSTWFNYRTSIFLRKNIIWGTLGYGRRAFCVAGPSVWNSLPENLRNPIIGGNSFRQSLKTFLFATYWCIQRIRGFTSMRYINRLFTYLLTYIVLFAKKYKCQLKTSRYHIYRFP